MKTGRPAYHPAILPKLYIYGCLNRIQSSRRLERDSQRNIALIWLLERLTPDFKTIANFRNDNGTAIRKVCTQFVALCRQLKQLNSGRKKGTRLRPFADRSGLAFRAHAAGFGGNSGNYRSGLPSRIRT